MSAMDIYVITHECQYDDDVCTFKILGAWPKFEDAIDELTKIKSDEDDNRRIICDSPTQTICISSERAHWHYFDFGCSHYYSIEKTILNLYIVQPKVELTQLDKNILEAAIAFVEQNNHFNCWRGVDKHTVLSALHSLRPQNHWKPSYEQMKVLKEACDEHWESDDIDPLYTLYRDLKKLREA
jgi:hypothetical protein